MKGHGHVNSLPEHEPANTSGWRERAERLRMQFDVEKQATSAPVSASCLVELVSGVVVRVALAQVPHAQTAANLLGRHVPGCHGGEHSRQRRTEGVAQSCVPRFRCVSVTPVIGMQVPPNLDILRRAGRVINGYRYGL